MRLNVVRTLSRAQKQQGSLEKKRYFLFWVLLSRLFVWMLEKYSVHLNLRGQTFQYMEHHVTKVQNALASRLWAKAIYADSRPTTLLLAQPSIGEVLGFQTLLLWWSQLLEISCGECAQLRGAENPESKRILCSNISSSGLLEQFYLFCLFRERLKIN